MIAGHREQSGHGPPSEDDRANMSHYNLALNMGVANVTGAFGAFGGVEYSTNGAPTDADPYDQDAINQPSHIGQDFNPQTRIVSLIGLPISETISVPYEQQMLDFDDFSANVYREAVPASDGNNTYLVGSPADQSVIWSVALEPQIADPPTYLSRRGRTWVAFISTPPSITLTPAPPSRRYPVARILTPITRVPSFQSRCPIAVVRSFSKS